MIIINDNEDDNLLIKIYYNIKYYLLILTNINLYLF